MSTGLSEKEAAFIAILIYIILLIILIAIIVSIINTAGYTKRITEQNEKIIQQNDTIIGLLIDKQEQQRTVYTYQSDTPHLNLNRSYEENINEIMQYNNTIYDNNDQ